MTPTFDSHLHLWESQWEDYVVGTGRIHDGRTVKVTTPDGERTLNTYLGASVGSLQSQAPLSRFSRPPQTCPARSARSMSSSGVSRL